MSKRPNQPRPSARFRKDSVIVSYLHPASEVGGRFHKSMLDLLIRDSFQPQRLVAGKLDMTSGANITTARNTVVRDFLATDATWLWLIDADMVFAPDTLDALLDIAHPTERPIVGGLCFKVTQVGDGPPQQIPTLYGLNDMTPPRTVIYHDFPPDTLLRVAATGAACLLVHRSVLERMRDSGNWRAPWTWFAETLYPEYDDVVSEDITFCLRAGALGFPIFVHTGIDIGHQKTVTFNAQTFQSYRPTIPRFAVIPGLDRHDMTAELIEDLQGQCDAVLVYDNGSTPAYDFGGCEVINAKGWNLHEMWNAGLAEARSRAPICDVMILNNDLRVGPKFAHQLSTALRFKDDVWVAYPNVHGLELQPGQVVPTSAEGQTVSGYAFMVRGESGLSFDEQFEFWYGDFDLEMQVRAAGKLTVCVGGCTVEHLEPTKSTTGERLEQAKADEKRFAAKWDLDPESLFLAANPGWNE